MMEKEVYNPQRRWILIAFLLCLCFTAGSIFFLTHMEKQYMEENLRYLDNAAQQNKTAIVKQVEGDLQTLHGVAVFVGEMDITDLGQLLRLVGEVNERNAFIRMGIATLDGTMELMELGGAHYRGLDVSGEEFFQRAAAGENAVSRAMPDPYREGAYIHYYAVPVINREDAIVGVLCAVNDASVIRKILDAPLLSDAGFTDLYDSEGKMILRSIQSPIRGASGSNLWDLDVKKEEDRLAIQKALEEFGTVHFTHRVEEGNMLSVLQPVGVADWFTLSSVSVQALRQRYVATTVGAVLIIVAACCLFLLLLEQQRRMMARNQAVVERMAYEDELTGGRNYNKFLLEAETARRAEGQWAIWFCDLKKFKYYNDALGYQMGDEMLCQIYQLFAAMERQGESFCRMTADNFVGVRLFQRREELAAWFDALLAELSREESESSNRPYIELCMGFYCPGPEDEGLTVNEMVNRANMAQKSIKGQSGSGCAFYTEELRQQSLQQSRIESQGQQALTRGQFQPYFQPKYDIQHGVQLAGAEVLCRWLHPEKGMIPPNQFIPVFEKTGLIVELDRYMFREVCRWYRGYLDGGGKEINLAVNVSRVGLLREDFVAYYTGVKEEFHLPDNVIELEVTESLALGGEELLVQLVQELQQNGFTCSLDDFGSGYSSLNLLKNLPINVLKLDILFFRQSVDKVRERIVLRNIINMARELSIRVIAEGVETMDTVNFLREAGCDTVQGYVFAKPMPLTAFEDLLHRGGAPETQA